MINLYTFGPYFGMPDASPFVTKAMALLKISETPYTARIVPPKDLGKTPKGKLPYIEDEGEIVADSTFIRWHIEKKYGYNFDRGLSDSEKSTAWAIEKMLEDNFYWIVMHSRWMDDANFAKGPAHYFDGLPAVARGLVRSMVRRKTASGLQAHGMGRYTPAERLAIASKDIAAVAGLLGDKPYLFGNEPCGADATAYAFIAGSLCPHFDSGDRTLAESHVNLVAYVARMKARYFS
jgi:glutathione S-transferase